MKHDKWYIQGLDLNEGSVFMERSGTKDEMEQLLRKLAINSICYTRLTGAIASTVSYTKDEETILCITLNGFETEGGWVEGEKSRYTFSPHPF